MHLSARGYCNQVKSKDQAKTLLEVPSGWDGGLGETQSYVTCSKTWSQTRKPSPLHARHDSGQLDSGMKRVSSGCRNRCNLRVTGQALSQPQPPRQSPGEALRKRVAAGLGGPGAVRQVQVSPSASWNGGPSRWVAAARGPGAPASQLASEPIPGGDFVMAEHSCICTDDPLICARKVRILLQIPGASPSIWLVALKVSHRFQHVKPPLQEYYWVWGRGPPLSVSWATFALRLLFHSSHTQSQQACRWFKEPMLPCSLGGSVYLLSREKTALEEMH